MSATIYLCGHGSWKPENGFTTVPKNCSIGFIGMHAKTVYTNAMIEACKGTYDDKLSDEFGEYRQVPNMTWDPDEEWKVDACEKAAESNPNQAAAVFPDNTTTLKEFFETPEVIQMIHEAKVRLGGVRFVWSCCRYVKMKGAVHGRGGFNATHDIVGGQFHFRDRVDGSKIVKQIAIKKTR